MILSRRDFLKVIAKAITVGTIVNTIKISQDKPKEIDNVAHNPRSHKVNFDGTYKHEINHSNSHSHEIDFAINTHYPQQHNLLSIT